MSPKHTQNFSVDEVGMWLVAIGLGSKVETFRSAGVDGSMLVILGETDFAELDLSGLQGKKLLTSLESSKAMAEGGGGGGGGGIDPKQYQALQDENMALRQQLQAYVDRDRARAAPPAAAPAPSPPPPPQQQQHHQSKPPM